MEKVNKREVQKLLISMQGMSVESDMNKDETLNRKKFKEVKQTKDLIKNLKTMGVTNEYLQTYFSIAGLMLFIPD